MSASPTDAAVDVVRRFDGAVVDAGDLDLAMTFAHPDMTVREPPGLPYRGGYVGRQGLEELMEDFGAWWEILEPLTMRFMGVSDSLVAVRISSPRARLRATGREVPFLVTEWITVRDGKVADVEVFYYDQQPLIEAAGVVAHRQPVTSTDRHDR